MSASFDHSYVMRIRFVSCFAFRFFLLSFFIKRVKSFGDFCSREQKIIPDEKETQIPCLQNNLLDPSPHYDTRYNLSPVPTDPSN